MRMRMDGVGMTGVGVFRPMDVITSVGGITAGAGIIRDMFRHCVDVQRELPLSYTRHASHLPVEKV
jgi:hypothetical protein